MRTHARIHTHARACSLTDPSDSTSLVASYFADVVKGSGSTGKAGVGMGVYYDGRNGYAKVRQPAVGLHSPGGH